VSQAEPSAQAAKAFLSAHGWLSRCPRDFAQAILAAGIVRHVRPGDSFNIAGDETGGIWGIAAGQAGVFSGMNSPGAPLSLLLLPGDWGGIGPIFGFPRLSTGIAQVPTTLLHVPLRTMHQLLSDRPDWWEPIGQLGFEYARQYGRMLVDLQIGNSRARFAAVLLDISGLRGEGTEGPTLSLSQEELGVMANLSRHPASGLLKSFEQDGLVQLGYRTIRVTQAAGLRAIADGD
jgi:CRP-like cAMP-binding protein